MRLYSRTDAAVVEHGGTRYEPSEDGSFELPEELGLQLHAFHIGGKPMWETDIERQQRLISEELERRKDPATLLEAVEQLVKAAQATKEAEPASSKPAPAKRASKRAASASGD